MSAPFDPVLVEVINNELGAITEEMAIVLWRTGYSTMMKSGDFATAICDGQGRIIGQGFAAPFQLAAFDNLMDHVRARYSDDFAHGDILVTNDPYGGMTHMPDVGVIVPVMMEGRVAAFCIAYSHHSDAGGRFPGSSSSQCRSSYEEGLRIPMTKLVDRGVRNDALLELVRANVRVPHEWLGDLEAKIAGCQRGAEQIEHLVAKHGWDSYLSACDYVIDFAERSMRAAIAETPDGVYTAEYHIADNGNVGSGDDGIDLRLTIEIAGDRMIVDFAGSSPQVDAALNMPLTMTKAAVYGALKIVIGADLPANHGFFRPVTIRAASGSVVNPIFPAAVAGRAPLFFCIFDLMTLALSKALPGKVPVTGQGGDLLHFSGHGADREEVAFLDLYFGGWGARPTKDGIDGVAMVYMGSYGCASCELVEAEYPVVYEGFGFECDSEGAGRFRGSAAIFRHWRFLQPGHAMVRSVRIGEAPGFSGGGAGRPSRTLHYRGGRAVDLSGKTHVHLDVQAGDRIYHATAGAGGYGDARERDPQLVLNDWRAGLLSVSGARERYGVALDPLGTINWPETHQLRASASASG